MEEEKKISKYSSGVNIIMRLDTLWKDTHTHSRIGSFGSWNSDLDRIWLELARDLNEKDFTAKETAFKKFDEDLEKQGNFQDQGKKGFGKLTPEEITKRNEQYKILMEKQLFLSRLENHLGKGTSWDDEDDDDFD